jgi:acyl phosphate:glycerol-3-phosphate acyltransferase
MNWSSIAVAAVVGYLVGSFSLARLVVRLVAPGADMAEIEYPVPHTAEVFSSNSLSATSVRFQLGARYGCLIALLDILKAAVVTLAFKLWQPDTPYYLIAATGTIVGHNYPLYYRFRGGRGLATVYGGFVVLDWIGVLVTSLAGMATGILVGQVLLIRWAGLLFMIPWIWFRTHDLAQLAYVLVANGLFWRAMVPELRQYWRLRREGKLPDAQEIATFMGMGSMYRVAQRFSLIRLLSKRRTAVVAGPPEVVERAAAKAVVEVKDVTVPSEPDGLP